MSDPTLQPIWTPEDARQTARDAETHDAVLPIGTSVIWNPFADNEGPPIRATIIEFIDDPWLGLLYQLEWIDDSGQTQRSASTLSRVSPDVSDYPFKPTGAHRAPARGRHRVELVVGMRPRHAMLISRVLIAAAVLVLVAAVAAVWAMGVAR